MIVKFHFLFSVDCEWDRFGAWTECSTTCGEGFQRRRRTVKQRQRNGGKPCRGSETQSRNCNKGACSGKQHLLLALKFMNKINKFLKFLNS